MWQVHNIIVIFFFSINILFPTCSAGQSADDVDPELLGLKQDVAAEKVEGEVLQRIPGISSFPAELRAASISKRIIKAAKGPSVPADSIRIIAGEDRLMIYAGD